MEFYDKAYDRVNVKSERQLKRIDRIFHTVTTTDDPIIRKLTKTQSDVNVFATDSILATLMCCTRSVLFNPTKLLFLYKGKVYLGLFKGSFIGMQEFRGIYYLFPRVLRKSLSFEKKIS